MTGGFLILIALVGVALFVAKLMLSRGAAWVERSFNADVAEVTAIANQQAPPASWLAEAEAHSRDAAGKQLLLSRLDRAIRRVEGGRAFEADARQFALQRLRPLRDRWGQQTLDQIRASAAPVADESEARA